LERWSFVCVCVCVWRSKPMLEHSFVSSSSRLCRRKKVKELPEYDDERWLWWNNKSTIDHKNNDECHLKQQPKLRWEREIVVWEKEFILSLFFLLTLQFFPFFTSMLQCLIF
jgi:hypothetical protein